MKTKDEVLDAITYEILFNNSVIYASVGNGGSGLDISNNESIIKELSSYTFYGIVEAPCNDLIDYFNDGGYECYQFEDDFGYIVQILVTI